ncbi:MAG: dienelactone hydrolase family protein [Chloroflexi bacterium]|nr:dienelactone hydrolase family protein [Chloroflexota bacterium]
MGQIVEFSTEKGTANAYLAVPQEGRGPGILLLHAWWGLNGFIKRLADRFAAEGFIVLAPDLYGGPTAATIEEAEKLVSNLDDQRASAIALASVDYLLGQSATESANIRVVGFSLGAAYAAWLTKKRPQITSAVLFYGGAEQAGQEEGFASATNAAFLGHFAEDDDYEPGEFVPRLQEQLHSAGKEAHFYIYPGTGHWFFEEDRPSAYNADAAELAWTRTLEFLRR